MSLRAQRGNPSEGIPFDDKTPRNGVWLDVKIMCKNAVFRARIYYLYNKNC